MFDLTDLPDLSALRPEELRSLLSQVTDFYAEVEARDPGEDSEDYETWLEDLDEIEDLMEEIEERLDPS